MAEHWSWTPLDDRCPGQADETGLDDDDPPCPYCGEEGCEDSCTGAILAREAAREDDHA